MATADTSTIILESPARCRITLGNGRTYYSTPHAVAAALLATVIPEEQETATATRSIHWQDHLASHGLALGTRGQSTFTLAVIPATERTIHWAGPLSQDGRTNNRQREYTVTFPPLLVGLHMRQDRFQRGSIWCVNPTMLATLSVTNPANVLHSFPYSNVYAGRGDICWGTIAHADIGSLQDFLSRFFGSGFNGDLYDAGGITDCNGRALPELAAANLILPGPPTWPTSIPTAIANLVGGGR